MSRYRRVKIKGGMFFFTVAMANRRSDLLVRNVDLLRRAYRIIRDRRPFETVAICILPDHLHAIWRLPEDDADYAMRWNLIHFNPVKHGLVPRVCDWPHSSFHRFVERNELPNDWGGDNSELSGEFGE